jgi:hypothetical protein
VGIALIGFCTAIVVVFVLAWRLRRGRNPADQEPQLTTAAKHFIADLESRAREKGPRWEAPNQEEPPAARWRKPRRRGKGAKG